MSVNAADDCRLFDRNLVGHYTFDGLSGGTLRDRTNTKYATTRNILIGAGKINKSGILNANSKLSLGTISPNFSNGVTISTWVYPYSDNTRESRFISKAVGLDADMHYIMAGSYNNSALRFRLRTNNSTDTLISANGVLNFNQWNFVTFTYDFTSMRIYRDGILVAQSAKTGRVTDNNSVKMAIGNQPEGAGSRHFSGKMDDLRFYNGAMNVGQINALMWHRPSACDNTTSVQAGGGSAADQAAADQAAADQAAADQAAADQAAADQAAADQAAADQAAGANGNYANGNYADNQYGVLPLSTCPGIPTGFPKTYSVGSYSEFKQAYQSVQPGEAIIIKNGTYNWAGDIPASSKYLRGGKQRPLVLNRGGTPGNPIYILAETRHGVTFSNTIVNWVHAASHIVVAGIDFYNAGPHYVIATDNRIACSNFEKTGWTYIVAENHDADRLEVDNNLFNGSKHNAVQLWRCNPEDTSCVKNSKGAHVHHNTFTNKLYDGGNGHEAIVLGIGYSAAPGVPVYNADGENMDAIIENNLFDGWDGENELISIKSSRNILRNNCVINAPHANFKLRIAYNNTLTGNWMERSGNGLEVSGKGNVVAFNYMSNSAYAALRLHVGERVRAADTKYANLYQYIDATNNQFESNVFNRFVNMIEVSPRFNHRFLANPTNNIFRNNDFYSTGLRGSNDGGSYFNKDGNVPESVFRNTNTWGYNAVIGQHLPASSCGNASHFSGPGGSTATVPGHAGLLNSPATINAPSWW